MYFYLFTYLISIVFVYNIINDFNLVYLYKKSIIILCNIIVVNLNNFGMNYSIPIFYMIYII